MYIHPENQELLWKVVNKNPVIEQYFSTYPTKIQESWFKQIISSFYEQNRNNVANSDQLYEINKNTLTYMVQDINRNVQYVNEKRRSTTNQPDASTTLSSLPPASSPTVPCSTVLRTSASGSSSDKFGQEVINRNTQLNQNIPTSQNDFLKPHSVTENREDKFTNQYNQYQQNYQAMFDKKVPESIDFREKFDDQPISGNMDELVQRHLRERDEELKRYAMPPVMPNLVPIINNNNNRGNTVESPPFFGNASNQLGQINSITQQRPQNANRLVIDPSPENVKIAVEEIVSSPYHNRETMLRNEKRTEDYNVKWLDNENSDKIHSLEQEITILKGQVLQMSDKISFLINANKDIFDFSAQKLKMSPGTIMGGFLFDPSQ